MQEEEDEDEVDNNIIIIIIPSPYTVPQQAFYSCAAAPLAYIPLSGDNNANEDDQATSAPAAAAKFPFKWENSCYGGRK